MFPITTVFLGGKNKASVDITESSNQSTSSWADITQVAITQNTPSGTTPSNIYHVVSFDNKATWKVFKSGAWTSVARNNSGTWQYSNAGSWTNASSNTQAQAITQATSQSAYQWQKSEVEALTSANWRATGGLTSGSYFHWATKLISGTAIVADGSQNTSTDYATNQMSTYSSGGHVASATSEGVFYKAWSAFDRVLEAYNCGWGPSTTPSSGSPQSLMIDLGSSNSKAINKYSFYIYSGYYIPPCVWQLQGTNNTSASVGDGETANGWTTLDSRSYATSWQPGAGWYTYTFSNSTAYRYYRFRCTSANQAFLLGELKLIEAGTTAVTPSFTKIAVQYES